MVVTADDSVTPEAMLEKLQKVRMINQIKINQHGIIITFDLSSRYDLQMHMHRYYTILYYTMLTNFKKLPAFIILLLYYYYYTVVERVWKIRRACLNK